MFECAVTPRPVDVKKLKQTPADVSHIKDIIDQPAIVRDAKTKQPLAIMTGGVGDGYPHALLGAVQAISYNTTYRTSGLKSRSRTVGFLPRVAIRRDFCCRSEVARETPGAHAIILEYAAHAAKIYRDLNGPKYASQENTVAAVRPEWRIPRTPFTSGIVNWDNRLMYHQDQGNFRDCWSAMIVLSKSIQGGELVVPSLNVAFRFSGVNVLLFDGAALLHGVAPILRRTAEDSFRYSIVYYALQGCAKCLSAQEELQRIRRVKTQREEKRVGLSIPRGKAPHVS